MKWILLALACLITSGEVLAQQPESRSAQTGTIQTPTSEKIGQLETKLKHLERVIFNGEVPAVDSPDLLQVKQEIEGLRREIGILIMNMRQVQSEISDMKIKYGDQSTQFQANAHLNAGQALGDGKPIALHEENLAHSVTVTQQNALSQNAASRPVASPHPTTVLTSQSISAKQEEVKQTDVVKKENADASAVVHTTSQAQAVATPQETQFKQAYALYSKGEYDPAVKAFEYFIQTYPENEKVTHALLLMGKCYGQMGKNSLARVSYIKAYQSNTRGEHAPEALLNLGLAFAQDGNRTADACTTWSKLEEDFKKMPEDIATKLKEYKKTYKCKHTQSS